MAFTELELAGDNVDCRAQVLRSRMAFPHVRPCSGTPASMGICSSEDSGYPARLLGRRGPGTSSPVLFSAFQQPPCIAHGVLAVFKCFAVSPACPVVFLMPENAGFSDRISFLKVQPQPEHLLLNLLQQNQKFPMLNHLSH